MNNVTSFTGSRSGATPADQEEFEKCIDDLAADLKLSEVTAYAVAVVTKEKGSHQVYSDWVKKPGVGMHELVGAVAALQDDLINSMPEVK